MITASNLFICDLPVRMDNYTGCSHQCSYCFVKLKQDLAQISGVDMSQSLRSFISGHRTKDLKMFDYKIPLHWGGVSDPFQPIERELRLSLKLLEIFRETQYPFVVSTKGDVINDYIEILKECNCVIQFSAVCSRYDKYEPNAMPFQKRIETMAKLSPYKRVIARVQPYQPFVFNDVLKSVEQFSEAGIYGLIFEAMKYKKKTANTIQLAGDHVYPIELLKKHFFTIKEKANNLGLKVFAGENRLRQFGDDLCCCGINGMGWQYHKANLNHLLFDKEGVKYTEGCTHNIAGCIGQQTSKGHKFTLTKSYKEILELVSHDKGIVEQLLPKR